MSLQIPNSFFYSFVFFTYCYYSFVCIVLYVSIAFVIRSTALVAVDVAAPIVGGVAATALRCFVLVKNARAEKMYF